MAQSADRVVVPFPEVARSANSKEGVIRVTYSGILKQLPQDLHGKITPPSSARFTLATDEVLEQLPKGAVKIAFGELRKSAPVGIFRNANDQDDRLVELPLREILSQVKPDSYARRGQQQRQELPEEISDLFGRKGELLARMRVVQKDEIAKPEAAQGSVTPVAEATAAPALSAPISAPTPIALSTPAPPIKIKPLKAAAPKPADAKVAAPKLPDSKTAAPKAAAPKAALPAVAPMAAPAPRMNFASESLTVPLAELSKFWPEAINREIVQQGLAGAQCALSLSQLGKAVQNGAVQLTWNQVRAWIRPALPQGVTSSHGDTVLEIPLKLIASLTLAQGQASTPAVSRKPQPSHKEPAAEAPVASEPPVRPATAAPVLPKTETASVAKAGMVTGPGGKQFLRLPLSQLWQQWPEALRRELAGSEYANSFIELPREIVEPGLKTGKVEVLWKHFQEFLKPSCNGVLAANFYETALDLPLPILVPLLFQNQNVTAPKRASAADDIPDVFNPAAKAPAAAPAPEVNTEAAAAQPSEPAPAPPAAPAATEGPKKEPKDLAELFGEPEKRNWTPNEIVHQTTLLPDVRGALIALQDGLLVASCMPPEWKTETIAAFLPQIFGRMNQYAKELKMGDLNCVSFTVDQGTLQIYNAGIIYFAALGQPGQPMPSCLNLIARELSRHTR